MHRQAGRFLVWVPWPASSEIFDLRQKKKACTHFQNETSHYFHPLGHVHLMLKECTFNARRMYIKCTFNAQYLWSLLGSILSGRQNQLYTWVLWADGDKWPMPSRVLARVCWCRRYGSCLFCFISIERFIVASISPRGACLWTLPHTYPISIPGVGPSDVLSLSRRFLCTLKFEKHRSTPLPSSISRYPQPCLESTPYLSPSAWNSFLTSWDPNVYHFSLPDACLL